MEGEPDTCFGLLIAVPFLMSPGLISIYETLGFEKRNDMKETGTHLQCMILIALPRYTFRQAFIKYRTPMIQFVKEDLFQKPKIQKILPLLF